MSEKCVQGTNDSSIVSKASAAERGYFDDPFLAMMVRKRARRAPLINRGYYIRMKAVDQALRHFISVTSGCDSTRYIVSLGAGFDTAYFRLKSTGLLKGVYFIEIDFYNVALNKARLIEQSRELSALIGSYDLQMDSKLVLRATDYCLVASDITHESVLDACFRELAPSWGAPFLFLSECVLTYVTPKNTSRLIDWIAQEFPCSVFFLYEQMRPFDSFGVIMCQHFRSIGSPLKCVEAYSRLSDQRQRFTIGWHCTEAMDMNTFYQSLDPAERSRIDQLEVFDEFEEWQAKCAHYFVLAALSSGFYHRYQPRGGGKSFFGAEEHPSTEPHSEEAATSCDLLATRPLNQSGLTLIPARRLPSDCRDQFRLHWAALCPVQLPSLQASRGGRPSLRRMLLRIGGYGRDPLAAPGHRRFSCVTLIEPYLAPSAADPPVSPQSLCRHLTPTTAPPCQPDWLDHWLGPLVFHTGRPGEVLVFGGKATPLKPSNRLLLLRLEETLGSNAEDNSESHSTSAGDHPAGQTPSSPPSASWSATVSEVSQSGSPDAPCPRWRHAGCSVSLDASSSSSWSSSLALIVYGGRTPDRLCLADAYVCRWPPPLEESQGIVVWESLPADPGPRCSHAMCAHPDPAQPLAFLSGGLTLDESGLRPLWDLWQLDVPARQWTQIRLSPRLSGPPGAPIPRFGHSLHGLTTACLSASSATSSGSSCAGGQGSADSASCWLVCFGGAAQSPPPAADLLPDDPCLCVLRLEPCGQAVAHFVNLGADFRLDSSVSDATFLTFNAAAALLLPPSGGDDAAGPDAAGPRAEPPLLAVVGGGGGCFSFGTHLNAPAVCLHLTDVFLPLAALF